MNDPHLRDPGSPPLPILQAWSGFRPDAGSAARSLAASRLPPCNRPVQPRSDSVLASTPTDGGSGTPLHHSDLFQTIAEVATAFTGFSGIVVALGGRARGEWQRADLSPLGTLLACSLGVVFFGFVPDLILAARVPVESAWRAAAFLFASYHLLVIVGSYWSRHVLRGPEDPLIGAVLAAIVGSLGLCLIVSQFITAAGFLGPWLFFVYLANLLWLLLVASLLFALLVVDILSARSVV